MMMADWRETAPGVWEATIGEPSGLSPLQVIGAAPKAEAMSRIPVGSLPFAWDDLQLEEAAGGLILSLPLDRTEKLYGTGLQFMRMNQRGRTRFLRVNSDPEQDTGETHAPVPFYVSDRGYGVLVDTSRIVTIFCGSTLRLENTREEDVRDRNNDSEWKATLPASRVEIRLPAEGVNVYLFSGPALSDVVRRYNLFCGGGVLPPRWGLGFWHRVPKLSCADDALREALEFRQRDFPCDVIGLEPGWHSRSYPVTNEWDQDRFPDPGSFLQSMDKNGFRVNLWEHPFVSNMSGLYPQLKPYSGSHTVWGGIAPDYSIPEAQEIYKKQHHIEHVKLGVSGYKLDECDGSELTNHSWMFPAHARFPSGLDGEQMRQLYGLMFQKMTDDLYRSNNRRTYGLVRASNAAASSMPYVLYSDLYDHKQFIRALCNASLSGLLWTPEVRKAQNAEDWVRRMQTVVFSPLAMLNAWGDGTKPWSYPEVESIIRHYIKLRMRLLPYLYTAFAQYREEGLPPFRATPIVMTPAEIKEAEARQAAEVGQEIVNTTDAAYGSRKLREWDDQYMVGDSMLVAPVFAGETEREVLLPSGTWFGLESGIKYEGGIVKVTPGLEQIPVFVRDGAIIPMMPDIPYVPQAGDRVPLEFVHFGTSEGTCRLYDDDGETFDYESGQCGWWQARARRGMSGEWIGEVNGPPRELASYSPLTWRFAQSRL